MRYRAYAPVAGNLVRRPIDQLADFGQAGERHRLFDDWERDDLIMNLVCTRVSAQKHIQNKMVEHFTQCDKDYGWRVREGL